MSFQVGDRVVHQAKGRLHGERGEVTHVVVYTDSCDQPVGYVVYAVQFDRPIPLGHHCSGWTVDGRGYWCTDLELSLEPTPIDHAGFLQLLGGDHGTII